MFQKHSMSTSFSWKRRLGS